MQLSNNYIGLFDYAKLDFLRKIHVGISKSSTNTNSKYYASLTHGMYTKLAHNVITDFDMVDHINSYPLDNRVINLAETNYKDNNKKSSNICYKKINYDETNKIYKGIIKCIGSPTNKFKSDKLTKEFDNKKDLLKWFQDSCLEIDKHIYESEQVNKLIKEYEDIMIKYGDGFKWCDNDDTKNLEYLNLDEQQENKQKEIIKEDTNMHEVNDEKPRKIVKKVKQESSPEPEPEENDSDSEKESSRLSKIDKYKNFKHIDKQFSLDDDDYDIDLKSNTIKHLTYKDIEYKYCGKCNKWNNIDKYNKSSSSIDKLYKYCDKKCAEKYNKNVSTDKWKENNKDKVKEYNKQYREQNRDKLLEKSRKPQEEKDSLIHSRQTKYYESFVEKCNEHEGSMVSESSDYETAHSKLMVKCKNNHQFGISWNNCKNGKWCPKCR